jgi:Holliday junction DNA helicase RuvA
MIGKLTVRVDSVGDDWVILDVGGVGYLVHCGQRTLSRLPAQGQPASLQIETQLREDRLQLLGFASQAERDWFRLLVTVQGVGARIALSILSTLEPDALVRAVASQDKAALARAEGVGPKLAQRIANELKDKAAGLMLGEAARVSAAPAAAVERGPAADAVSALVNLGYGRSEAFGAVAAVAGALGAKASVEALIKASLKELAQ